MIKAILLTIILFSGFVALQPAKGGISVETLTPTVFWVFADTGGFNSTVPPGNPTISQFRSVTFTANVTYDDNLVTHNFAIYTKGYTAVTITDACILSNTVGCLAKSLSVSASRRSTLFTFTPTVPPDDSSGPGGYEYYCQFHPVSMHGRIFVYKNPDIDRNRTVEFLDLALLAYAYRSTPTSMTWNPDADLDNNGVVDFLDLALLAFYYRATI